MSLLQVTNETLVTIFQTILSWHLETGGFPDSCRQMGPGIIAATLDMYSQSMTKLLPTPTKSHYTFNLRDFARVIQVLPSVPQALQRMLNWSIAQPINGLCLIQAAPGQMFSI